MSVWNCVSCFSSKAGLLIGRELNISWTTVFVTQRTSAWFCCPDSCVSLPSYKEEQPNPEIPSGWELLSKPSITNWTLCCCEPRVDKTAGRMEGFPWHRARFGQWDFRFRSDPVDWEVAGLGGFSLDVGCDIRRLRLQHRFDLLNPWDQCFDGTNTIFRLDGPGGVHEFLRCFNVLTVTWTKHVATPSFRKQVLGSGDRINHPQNLGAYDMVICSWATCLDCSWRPKET